MGKHFNQQLVAIGTTQLLAKCITQPVLVNFLPIIVQYHKQ